MRSMMGNGYSTTTPTRHGVETGEGRNQKRNNLLALKWGEIGWSSKEAEELTLEPDTERDPKVWIWSLWVCVGRGNGTPFSFSSKLLGFFLFLLLLLRWPLRTATGDFMKLNWKPPRGSSSSSSSGSSWSSLLLLHFLLHHAGILTTFKRGERRVCVWWFWLSFCEKKEEPKRLVLKGDTPGGGGWLRTRKIIEN